MDTRLLIESRHRPLALTHGVGRVERMRQSKITALVVWITIGLIGVGLTAHKGIFALIRARQAALELHGSISN